MNFRISNLRSFMENIMRDGKKKKRNVVHRIGYNKFSLNRFVDGVKGYFSDPRTKKKFKDVAVAVKNLFTK